MLRPSELEGRRQHWIGGGGGIMPYAGLRSRGPGDRDRHWLPRVVADWLCAAERPGSESSLRRSVASLAEGVPGKTKFSFWRVVGMLQRVEPRRAVPAARAPGAARWIAASRRLMPPSLAGRAPTCQPRAGVWGGAPHPSAAPTRLKLVIRVIPVVIPRKKWCNLVIRGK